MFLIVVIFHLMPFVWVFCRCFEVVVVWLDVRMYVCMYVGYKVGRSGFGRVRKG